MGIFTYGQLIKLYISNTWNLLYVNYISKKMSENEKRELEGRIPIAFVASQYSLFIKIVKAVLLWNKWDGRDLEAEEQAAV